MFGAADKLDAWEETYAARQQHGEGAKTQPALSARSASCGVPPGELPAPALVVDVVEETALGDQQRVRLEWTFCRQTIFAVNGNIM